jgi:hypothetical protein
VTNFDDPGPLVRPYAMTGGRTRSRVELAIESLVSTTPSGEGQLEVASSERQAIIRLCREVTSVAEVSALMRVPLGVARVLLGDMASEGLVRVHPATTTGKDQPSMELLERVLIGLHKL